MRGSVLVTVHGRALVCERVCDDVQLSEADRAELVCRYRRHRPIFYIRPVKEETVNLDPKVVILHDVITDAEIAKIKELATPRVRQGHKYNSQ